ncbi:MAG TPA: CHAT domain-containing protein [Pyrinomonadaceae bacterium]|nr:CHAT domain-containing protein [Pyrinomonadaceae bacterium]
MARQHHEQNSVKRYLLQQLSVAEQQEIELRLLSDDSFSAELDIAEDDLIDEYLAEELSRDERLKFEQDFLTTPERHSKLISAQAFKRYLDRIPAPSPQELSIFERLRKWLLPPLQGLSQLQPVSVALILLVIGVLGLIGWRLFIYKSDVQKGLVALNEAYRLERPVEARVSTLDYAPFVITRSGEPQQVNDLELRRARGLLFDAEKEQADADSAHALGKLHLLQKEHDKAIEYLEKAAKADTKNAQIYADLGAAYLEKGRLELDAGAEPGKGLVDLGRSLEYLKQSLEIDPNLLEALFNRGLVHQHQGLYQEAEADWRTYLEKDSSSQWAVEARQNLKLLEDRKSRGSQNGGNRFETFMAAYRARDDTTAWEIYRRNYAPGGNSLTKDLLDGLLTNKQSENRNALEYLGQLETRNAEDNYTSDLARIYTTATPQRQALLLQARQQVADGYELFRKNKYDEATESFANARSTFDKVGDHPESLAVAAAIANVAALKPDLAKAGEIVAGLVPTCEEKRYKWLMAQAFMRRAHIQSNLNNYSEAISDGNRALRIFQELKDLNGTLDNTIQLATLHSFLNDNEISMSFLERARTVAQEVDASPMQLWGIYTAVALNLSALQLHRAALDYQNEALQLALPLDRPLYVSRSYQYIGVTYGALREFDLAFENVHRAYEEGSRLGADGQNMMANASLRLGDLYRLSGDQTRALAAYEESSQLYESLNKFAHYNYAAHKGKFLSYLAQNNDALAAQELPIVLDLFEKYRQQIFEERQKNYFFDREQETYDLAIDFTYFRLGDQRRAFDYSEDSRARTLQELILHKDASPLTVAEIQQRLPEQVQIVQYVVLENRLLVWCITRSGFFSSFVEVESSKLTERVNIALTQIRQRDEQGAADSLKRLHDLLIDPIRSQLDPNKLICFIPDKKLHFLPFGALISTSSGRYLVQDYRVMTSPSATIFIESTDKARGRPSVREERLLAVGNPTFDRVANPNLPNLAGAEREVEGIAPSYPSRRLLIRAQATQKSVVEELPRVEVAHFAAHYLIDPRWPPSSKVLLAESSGLSSRDIYQMDLARIRLVVLSACQTGIEQQFRGEGPIGFARSFLVAGVPVVVASLWPVDSDATSELMILFHHFRTVGHLSTTEALTRAQQEIMTREKYHQPYYWAGFTAIGGYSEF